MNFTWRARSLLVLAAFALGVGLLLRQEPLAFAALTVVIWIGWEWANFSWRTLRIAEELTPRRRLVGGQGRRALVLAADQATEVQLEVAVSAKLAGLRCWIEDVLPAGMEVVDASPALVVDVRNAEQLRWRYRLLPAVTRRLVLPGLQVVVSDPQGLFRLQRFFPLRQELTVFPYLVRPQATVSVLKRQNVQMLPGTHRYRRPGLSTELLGIRDYQPGDPPRSIAWKATARLDRLMTCEYESEAPIRATLLADLSPAQFLGRPGPARADRIVAACASVARLLLADGDPVAALVVSRAEQSWLPHGLGERQLSRVLLRLLSFAEPLSVEGVPWETLTRLAWTCGYRRFPELFDAAINHAPAASFALGRRRQAIRQRRQLSLALAELYGGEPGLPMRLQFDDPLYRTYCRRLLEDHPGMADVSPLYDLPVSAHDDEAQALAALGRGLVAGVARASDNELFAIVGTVPAGPGGVDTLTEAVRVARAEHHRVLMIDVGADALPERLADPLARQTLADARQRVEADHFAELERRLTRLGGKIARLTDPRLMEKVAAEVDLLRSGRARVVGGRR